MPAWPPVSAVAFRPIDFKVCAMMTVEIISPHASSRSRSRAAGSVAGSTASSCCSSVSVAYGAPLRPMAETTTTG